MSKPQTQTQTVHDLTSARDIDVEAFVAGFGGHYLSWKEQLKTVLVAKMTDHHGTDDGELR